MTGEERHMPSTQHDPFPNLPHITPIACENCGGKAHLILLTAEAARYGHAVNQIAIWTFECVTCGHLAQYCVDD
jgi:hypothetical protein